MPRRRETPKPGQSKDSPGIRLHKALADAGVASRRAAEQLITEGRVSVNGEVVNTLPAWVHPAGDRVEVDGVRVRLARAGHTYLMVHKSRGVICTSRDPQGRRTINDLVPHKQRLFCVGRLDGESTGLVLLTDDGKLSQQLTHPRYEVPKTYEVSIRGSLSGEDIERLKSGLYLADRDRGAVKTRAALLRVLDRDRQRTRMQITLREGRNREIRRMLARLGHRVHRLKRTAIGPLHLKGVAPGRWRELTRHEVAALRSARR